MRLEVPVELALMDVPPELVTEVELDVVVSEEVCDTVEGVNVSEDDWVDVETVAEEGCVVVLLVVAIVLLLPDEVPLKLLDVVGMPELLDRVEVGESVIVPLPVEIEAEDVGTEVVETLVEDETLVVRGGAIVLLLYGPPLVEALDEEPVDAVVVVLLTPVGTLTVLLADSEVLEEEGEVPVVKIPVGPREILLLVPFPYDGPLVETVEEDPVGVTIEVVLELVGTLIVLLRDTKELEEEGEVPIVKIPVGPTGTLLLVPLPYGGPLVDTLGERLDDTIEEVPLAVLVGPVIVLLIDPEELEDDGEMPVVRGTVGPTEILLLVPLPYGGPLLEEDVLEMTVTVPFAVLELDMVVLLALEVETVVLLVLDVGTVVLLVLDVGTVVLLVLGMIEDETPVEIGTVGPTEMELLVPLP